MSNKDVSSYYSPPYISKEDSAPIEVQGKGSDRKALMRARLHVVRAPLVNQGALCRRSTTQTDVRQGGSTGRTLSPSLNVSALVNAWSIAKLYTRTLGRDEGRWHRFRFGDRGASSTASRPLPEHVFCQGPFREVRYQRARGPAASCLQTNELRASPLR